MTEAKKVDVMLALIRNRVIEEEAERFLTLDVSGCEISERADRRIRRNVERGRRSGHGGLTALKRVAVAAAAIIATLFLMSMAFPEIRDAYRKLFEGTPGQMEILAEDDGLTIAFHIGVEYIDEVGLVSPGEPSYVPEGYVLAKDSNSGENDYDMTYKCGDGREIMFSRTKVGIGSFYLTIDDYKYTAEDVNVNGYSGVLVTYPKDYLHQYILVFCDGSYVYFFHVIDEDISLDELFRMAESVYD